MNVIFELPDSELRRLSFRLSDFFDETTDEAWKVVEKYAALIFEEMRRLCPVDTGYLKSTIEILLDRKAFEALVGTWKTDYAHYPEFGTIHQAAQPYVRPAFEKYKDAFLRDLAKALDR